MYKFIIRKQTLFWNLLVYEQIYTKSKIMVYYLIIRAYDKIRMNS
jgi:hypothetical protein